MKIPKLRDTIRKKTLLLIEIYFQRSGLSNMVSLDGTEVAWEISVGKG